MSLRVLPAELGPRVRAGFTTRFGGVSVGPWAGLDLALHVDDDPIQVRANRRLLQDWAGAPVRFVHQVHGCAVLVEDGTDRPPGPEPQADAVVSLSPAVAAGVLVADCVPVLVADAEAGVVAAVHAGRVGLLAGVVEAAVAELARAGAQPARMAAALGPAAGPCCYEVGEAIRADAAQRIPQTWATTRWGSPSLDLRAGCAVVLSRLGVPAVSLVGGCTIEDEALYSYRRARATGSQHTGRFAGVVRMLA